MREDLMRKIIAVRRRTRDLDVLAICDYAEKRLTEPPLIITQKGDQVEIKQDINTVREQMDKKFDKTAYMRDYMRKRRAKNNGCLS